MYSPRLLRWMNEPVGVSGRSSLPSSDTVFVGDGSGTSVSAGRGMRVGVTDPTRDLQRGCSRQSRFVGTTQGGLSSGIAVKEAVSGGSIGIGPSGIKENWSIPNGAAVLADESLWS